MAGHKCNVIFCNCFCKKAIIGKSHPWTNSIEYQSRGKPLTNLQRHWSIQSSLKTRQRGHWSIRISSEIHMDQWLPNLPESSGLHRYRSIDQELSRTPNQRYFLESVAGAKGRSTAVQTGGVLQYKLEVYCGVSLSSMLRSQQGTALQMGDVLRYKLEVYCQYFSDKLYRLRIPEQFPIECSSLNSFLSNGTETW